MCNICVMTDKVWQLVTGDCLTVILLKRLKHYNSFRDELNGYV